MSDRTVQDEVIRYLADANVRAQGPQGAPISVGEAAKAAQFAHFLARRYYRDRLARSFRYSHRFRKQTGRIAEDVVDGTEFDRFLSECVMGSLESAQRVGEMARAHLTAEPPPGAWWPDLLDYEYAYFLQAATAERGASGDRPSPGISAVCRRFAWALPEMLPRLRAGEIIGDDLRREAMLLFSRTHAGRIYVVELEPELERVFRAADGHRTLNEIAEAACIPAEQAPTILASLAGIGAVQFPS
ncbi:MAG: hypothetical protein ACHP7P_02695 [Terriglobales bacterium]